MPRPMSPARAAARAAGLRFYMGPPCQHGHGEAAGQVARYTSTNACRVCVGGQDRNGRVRKPVRTDGNAEAVCTAAENSGNRVT